ncbi:RAD9, HUS1, RAD1-interacting nuclear orphan protein 1 [Hypomesus transpacificus]|uniref:RAD9, HUS1, RAD1-interacting nuclear orphan protein 1 n=1 Tax=Hypomesus transpacificus TaxID=137520 RepID=UPI001F07653F|nr:RAD9, HUS1, RAD1-interacting nuclear orphan protein 1 [Hypomesus transpacificus]XP_046878703.1 RAD9, HUS1, RAD1-interacting nuclear orphan protein 1 [Hypomesus transpacificus]
MPRSRKSRKKSLLKSPLLFLEPPLDGARYYDVPQVQAALNPKSFVSEEERQSNTALTSWVSPQFDQVQISAVPPRRGRRAKPATSMLDRSSQLSRKSTVCKFPSLSFENKTTSQDHQQKHAPGNKKKETVVGGRGVQQTSQHVQKSPPDTETPKCPPFLRKRTTKGSSLSRYTTNGIASTSCRVLEDQINPAEHIIAKQHNNPSCSSMNPGSENRQTPRMSNVFTPPDIETPELHQGGHSGPSTAFLDLLIHPSQPATPLHRQTLETLVGDTPERDYGVKVTWRRRQGLMKLLKERGKLSTSETLISI